MQLHAEALCTTQGRLGELLAMEDITLTLNSQDFTDSKKAFASAIRATAADNNTAEQDVVELVAAMFA